MSTPATVTERIIHYADGPTRCAYVTRATDNRFDEPVCHWQPRDVLGSALGDAMHGAQTVVLTLLPPAGFPYAGPTWWGLP